MLKRLIKEWLKRRGYQCVPLNYYHSNYYRALEEVQYNWLDQYGLQTIIDIGASNGGFARKIRKHFPDTRLLSFEPLPSSFAQLCQNFTGDSHFEAFNYALTDQAGDFDFHEHDFKGCSSLLKMALAHCDAYPGSGKHHIIRVRGERLDNVLEKNNIQAPILLKMDVQGAERKVLEGVGHWLDKVSVIFAEVNFNEMYQACPLFDELYQYLNAKGFKLEGMENISRSLINGSFLQGDATFIRTK